MAKRKTTKIGKKWTTNAIAPTFLNQTDPLDTPLKGYKNFG